MILRVGGLLERSRVNGPGERFVVWVQGCGLGCPGCFNPGLWTKEGGARWPVEELAARIHAVPGLRGVTVSGGEPLEQPEAVAELLALLAPRLDTVVFTGHTLEEARSDPRKDAVLARADLLVAGRFLRGQAAEGRWAGSSNKVLHALSGRIRADEAPGGGVEITLSGNGSAIMTGFPLESLRAALRGT